VNLIIACIAAFLLLSSDASAQLRVSAELPPGVAPVGYVLSSAQQAVTRYPAGTKLTASWDPFTAAELASNGVNRYEVQIEGPSPGNITVAVGTNSLELPALAIGDHKVMLRACNTQRCSDPATLEIGIDSVVPSAPRNFRITPTDVAVNFGEIELMGNAYMRLTQNRNMTPSELTWLSMRYSESPFTPLTRLSTIAFLDRNVPELFASK
jgi:hypothetical protein